MTGIEQEYIATRPKSRALYERARAVFPSGVTHDGRYMKPFPFYVDRAEGARKWDVDGHELIDLWSGHGALLLGHNPPEVVAAAKAQMEKGQHYSACHELELEMGELLQQMIPCAEAVRFYLSGTEAAMFAVRIARAYTGKEKIIKFRGHFHGYFDEGVMGVRPPFDAPMSTGVPRTALANVLLARHNRADDVATLIRASGGNVAAVIVDPICHGFTLYNRRGFLEELRRICTDEGVVLIFDEVVSGFRPGPGGAQAFFGVTPDLAIIAKAMGGGLPASAVVGKREIMDVMAYRDDPQWDRFGRLISQGTHNGNPVVMAAGLATLKALSTGEPQRYANRLGDELRQRLREVLERYGVPGAVYGDWSIVRILVGEEPPHPDLGREDG
ncbi:MAG TPA: aminotransferase class III-fold pyridoxal phosphate-dependent enzyme, partial [Bacillota bacterium]